MSAPEQSWCLLWDRARANALASAGLRKEDVVVRNTKPRQRYGVARRSTSWTPSTDEKVEQTPSVAGIGEEGQSRNGCRGADSVGRALATAT